jgi:hypothetical protein
MTKETNSLMLLEDSISNIRDMVAQSVTYQTQAQPIYSDIANKILAMFEDQKELDMMATKDLLKLLDLSIKAQLQPIEQLTKLVQSLEALYDKSELKAKIENLDEVISEINNAKSEASAKTLDDLVDIED